MNNELPEEHFITSGTTGTPENIKVKNTIQVELIRRFFGNEDQITPEQKISWIETYSKKFRVLLDRFVKADPHFFLHDQQSHEATLDLFERELYKQEGVVDSEEEAEIFEGSL